MSAYLEMWAKIHELEQDQITRWIAALEPAKGVDVDFEGLTLFDVDLLQALRNAL